MDSHMSPHRLERFHESDMDRILTNAGVILTSFQLRQLWTYHSLIRQYNAQLNLTRIHNFTNMILKLYVDSILPARLMEIPSPLLDIGSGPGMPGIPLKIACPDVEIRLAESRKKRVAFLEIVVQELKLEKAVVIGKAISPHFETPVNAIITRAVEDIASTLTRITGCLAYGGKAIFMKGPGCDAEITAATQIFKSQYRLVQNTIYTIPNTPYERRLVVFQRLDEPLWQKRFHAMNRFMHTRIESDQNAVFKQFKKLLTGRGIKKYQMALISGAKQTAEAIRDVPLTCRAWISSDKQPPPPQHAPDHIKWYQLSTPLFKTIDVENTQTPLLLVEIPKFHSWDPRQGLPHGANALIPFQDPENVGAVIRSAVAFGIKNIILLAESAHPFHPKALRASAGAVLKAVFYQGPPLKDIPETLPIVALSTEGQDISSIEFPATFGFLPGMEGAGLPDHFRRKSFSIPIQKDVESLNAAAATAIAFFIWRQKHPVSQDNGLNKS